MKTNYRLYFIVFGLSFTIAVLSAARTASSSWSGWSDTSRNDPDIMNAEKAIKDKNWNKAVELLNTALARDKKNADVYNMLGYAERNRGNIDVAFKYYEQALTLNPKHRGAHEYIGEAYLMVGDLAKAEEHLATLDKLCFFPCEEYSSLKTAIAAYKQKSVK
ncbi:MAG TPA: tetratricopeptide repeat protein [Nitrospirota bacterium]|nr:tetratricopeptide repeat protein [Nitrospirota bacterium]